MTFFKRLTQEKMCKNCKEAVKERASFFYPFFKGEYVPLKEVSLLKERSFLNCTVKVKSSQGRRAKMEDESFIIENEKGILSAVFDGHNGVQVAQYVKNRFLESFFSLLESFDDNVYETFLHFFYLIQDEIEHLHPEWDQIGSTAVVSYLEKSSSYIYTATLGDSEATLYRKIKGKWKSLPLSPLRNWSTKRDFASAKKALGEPLLRKKNPKEMRYPPPGVPLYLGFGINVSRAFGDVAFKGVIHSPKITLTTLLPGDVLILACDGVKDFVSEKEILGLIGSHPELETLENKLMDYTLYEKASTDNVTFITFFVGK